MVRLTPPDNFPDRIFGTDGIRGCANDEVINPEILTRVARISGYLAMYGFLSQKHEQDNRQPKGSAGPIDYPEMPPARRKQQLHRVVIGKDTRLSGYMLEPALTAGFVSVGMDVMLVGPIPTPALAMLTQSMRADLGVMISASHNRYQDNGIKLFSADGYKLAESSEREIERLLRAGFNPKAAPEDLGRAKRIDDAVGRYIEFVKSSFPKGYSLEGFKIVVDCAHGAAYKVAPTILQELGAEVFPLHVEPNGININDGAGSIYPENLMAAVQQRQADIGIALDGDADRVLLVDEQGEILNGDQILAIIANDWCMRGVLGGTVTAGVVGTLMSNLGLEQFIQSLGIDFTRVDVGDKNIIQKIRYENYRLGAEPSGHVVMKNYSTTGDGLMAALQVLCAMQHGKTLHNHKSPSNGMTHAMPPTMVKSLTKINKNLHVGVQSKMALSQLKKLYQPVPEKTLNIKLAKQLSADDVLNQTKLQTALATIEKKVRAQGGLYLVRPSGTEKSLVRITLQLQDKKQLQELSELAMACFQPFCQSA